MCSGFFVTCNEIGKCGSDTTLGHRTFLVGMLPCHAVLQQRRAVDIDIQREVGLDLKYPKDFAAPKLFLVIEISLCFVLLQNTCRSRRLRREVSVPRYQLARRLAHFHLIEICGVLACEREKKT